MTYVHSDILDSALLEIVRFATELHICSSEPVDRSDVLTKSLGIMKPLLIDGPSSSLEGRVLEINPSSQGIVTQTGTATHYAIIDDSRLLISNSLSAPEEVTENSTFFLEDLFIELVLP